MKDFVWNPEKNEILKKTRGISFERVVMSIDQGYLLAIEENSSSKYQEQGLMVVNIEEYAYVVPFVESEKEVFLKTIFPSRKATKKYLK